MNNAFCRSVLDRVSSVTNDYIIFASKKVEQIVNNSDITASFENSSFCHCRHCTKVNGYFCTKSQFEYFAQTTKTLRNFLLQV